MSWTLRALAFALAVCLSLPASDAGKHPVTGRKIADVMGYGGWQWLLRPERAEEEKPDLAIHLMGVEEGMTVADIGAGAGYFSVRLAKKVGPEGKVYANDIEPRMLELLKAYAAKNEVDNIQPVLGAIDDPQLPAGALDLALMVDVYHEFSEPQAMLAGIKRALKPGGRIVLLEYRKEDRDLAIKADHKMSVKTVRRELEHEGFEFVKLLPQLPRQHLLIFEKPKS
jgi:ubiquinone/menaquinone biosynthesis C-methylase UbiE